MPEKADTLLHSTGEIHLAVNNNLCLHKIIQLEPRN